MAKAPEHFAIMKLPDLSPILEEMEDKHLDSPMLRTKNYTTLINKLEDMTTLDDDSAERLITICHKDLVSDLQYSSSAIMIITQVLKKIQQKKCEYPASKLVQSALIIVRITKKLLTKTLLRKLGFEALFAYPDETLQTLVVSYSEAVIDLINYHPHLNFQTEITCWVSKLIIRILNVLSHNQKLLFVDKGLNTWFGTYVPAVMTAYASEDGAMPDSLIEALQLLTETLKYIDYSSNEKWQLVLKDICDKKRYPMILKTSLTRGNQHWHTLWKIFILLLKDQITKVYKTGASPINALLLVVEDAFRMDPSYRCKAFECWNVLIDNFSTGLNESLVEKRLKLLMIPLKLNNAKVEETVVSKMDTWWHLIRRFHGKIDKFTDTVLIPFVTFCFGKPGDKTKDGKPVTVPGQMSNTLALKCVDAFVEIVGHKDCDGFCVLPRVEDRLITTKLLVEHWTLWLHAFRVAMKTGAENYSDPVIKSVKCLWKGFLTVISELPDNQIRADLVTELLNCVDEFVGLGVGSCIMSPNDRSAAGVAKAQLVFEIIINSLLEDNPRFRQLLKNKHGVILRIIQSNAVNFYLARNRNLEENITRLKPIALLMFDKSISDPDQVLSTWLAQSPFMGDVRILLWAAIVDALFDTKCNIKALPLTIQKIVLLPFKEGMEDDEYESEAIWYRWYKLYDHVQLQMPNSAKLDEDIFQILSGKAIVPITLKLIAAIALLKQKLVSERSVDFLPVAQVLLDVLGMAQGLVPGAIFPILADTLILIMGKIRTTSSVDLVKVTIMLLGVTLKCINISLKNCNDQAKKPIYVKTIQDKSKEFLDKINKTDTFSSLKSIIANTYKIRAEIDHTIACKTNSPKPIIISNVDVTPRNEKPAENNEVSDKTNFTTPQPKSAKKTKTNKKVPNIVNTVVENGEEFVVVKSNWKFNPKKLTENQKEKFKRKREDIPALYQDLSQSQDEFKLTTWKTDSQDASSSTSASKSESNSKTNDDAMVILKKLPSTEVVPKIIENIISDGANKNKETTAENVDNDNNNKKLEKTPTPKGPKTPRLALKDRVFRNVRNLIEKSGLQDDEKITNHVIENANQTVATVNENDLKTPISKVKTVTILNSAPSKLTTERPARSIKKPKKFDDTEIFAMKKKRRASVTAESDSQSENNEVLAMKRKRRSISMAQCDSQPDELPDAEKETTEDQITAPTEKVDAKEREENSIKDKNNQNEATSDGLSKSAEPDVDVAKAPTIDLENSEKPQSGENNNDKADQIESTNDKIVIEDCETPRKEVPVTKSNDNVSQVIEEISTPNAEKTKKSDENPSTTKKRVYKSRIAAQLSIDMVEGHPVLQEPHPDKRKTRKNLTPNAKDTVSKRRERLIEKTNKIKAELPALTAIEVVTKDKTKPGPKTSPKSAQKAVSEPETAQLSQSVTIVESQDRSFESQDVAMSEDVIESSQDSTLTTISVRSATKKKLPVVRLDKENVLFEANTSTQKLIDNEVITLSDTLNDTCNETGEDIELPKNKTMPEENAKEDLTENMDTEPMDSSGEVILINDEVAPPIVINTEETVVGKETQELAEADTLPMDVESQVPLSVEAVQPTTKEDAKLTASNVSEEATSVPDNDVTHVSTQDDMTPTLSGPAKIIEDIIVESSNTGSPLKDEIQRKKDFLNDTIEISPIKTLSPVREKKTPSPETSSDYVVIKLTSPVQSNGEPFNDKCDSPEVFTEDKVSPDKRDQSPPRKEVAPANSSPSSLSLKKNRPQMRFNGRAGQMLGLCVPEKLQILNSERTESDEVRKSPVSTPARRNLKRFYADNESQANEESEESENFLKFTRPLPAAESSPATPILKRKLAEISDESTVSPASKRKRVSFHDPPVSTTVAVQKYIEPMGVRSPSNSAIKRQERQIRALTNAKSPKRLDNVFRLETVLTKAVESFSDEITTSNDTEMSLDETPMAEVVKTSELNDTDPICPELLDCNDPIENIAGDLSSPSTKALLIKELEGKVETVADLAKMTELEVNRLCIKAPKVKVAKKVLSKYAAERAKSQEIVETPITPDVNTVKEVIPEPTPITPPVQPEVETSHNESQTELIVTKSSESQTTEVPTNLAHTQTDAVPITHCSAQTDESGAKSTKNVISTCLKERPDFVEQLTHQLQESSIRQISDKLPLPDCLSLVLKKMTEENYTSVVNKLLLKSETISKENHLKILQDHLCERFESKDLILFCSELLQKIHKMPS